MGVKVKRKLWVLSAFMPVRLRYNNKAVGTLYGSQDLEILTDEDEGELRYHQPIGRNDRLNVKSGDIVQVEETVNGKLFSLLFVALMIYLFSRSLGIINFINSSNYEELLMMEQIIFGIIFVIALIGFFFKTHKLVLLNR